MISMLSNNFSIYYFPSINIPYIYIKNTASLPFLLLYIKLNFHYEISNKTTTFYFLFFYQFIIFIFNNNMFIYFYNMFKNTLSWQKYDKLISYSYSTLGSCLPRWDGCLLEHARRVYTWHWFTYFTRICDMSCEDQLLRWCGVWRSSFMGTTFVIFWMSLQLAYVSSRQKNDLSINDFDMGRIVQRLCGLSTDTSIAKPSAHAFTVQLGPSSTWSTTYSFRTPGWRFILWEISDWFHPDRKEDQLGFIIL